MYVHKQPVANKPGHFRFQICVSERIGKTVKRRILRHFGVAKTPYEVESVSRFDLSEIDREMARRQNYEPLFDASNSLYDSFSSEKYFPSINDVKEESRKIEGFKDVYGTLFDNLFSDILPKNDEEILKEVVLGRISKPCSKRKTQEILEKDLGFSSSLSSIYRMMDSLHEHTADILSKTFENTCDILENKIDVMFFDVTTLYIESFSEDELRKFGYSKDQKYHNTQVVLALSTTSNGLPIGYKLFPGNTAETKTLLACIEEWSKILKIGKIIFVADSAMSSFENLYELEKQGIEFVVCAKMKNYSKNIKSNILNSNGYFCHQIQDGECLSWSKEMIHELQNKNRSISGRLIVSYSQSRAKKDKSDRDKIIEKLKSKISKKKDDNLSANKKISAKKLISNSGYLKYTKVDDTEIVIINENKIKSEEEWDGLHGLFTNSKKPLKEIMNLYRRLWVIEESFRINKTDLSMRPIYHFKPERIKSHIAICYISFSLIRIIQYKLEQNEIKFSPEKIREELTRVQVSIYKDKHGCRYRVPSSISEDAAKIYSILNLKRKLSVSKL